ncbi:unnamed protein product [[Candida] boidinii]|nr:unnamed protein product [[Candida] boidinii]
MPSFDNSQHQSTVPSPTNSGDASLKTQRETISFASEEIVPIETNVFETEKLSSTSLYSNQNESTEIPTQYTGGSLGRKVNGAFKSFFVIACLMQLI